MEIDGETMSDPKPIDDQVNLHVNEETFEPKSFLELSRSSWHPAFRSELNQTYLRGCKWSLDGTCCLAVVHNDGVHVLNLPKDLYGGSSVDPDRSIDVLDSAVHVPENGLVYDFCWYPYMNSMVPETCCWLTTGQNKPVQMWDAFDGSLRCSYRGYNAVDEVEAAISICFSTHGNQIHAGYKKCIKTFDVERPGREYVNQKIVGSAASMAVSSCHDLIAVGSWKTDISLYNMQEGNAKSMGKMRGHGGGITHLQFLPDGSKLLSGARKDSQINIWDLRIYKVPLKTFHRKVDTNQRIYFDVSKCGKYLLSGSTNGVLHVWNLADEMNNGDSVAASNYEYPLHKDCCNGISIHPCRPIIATTSGQHHFSNDIWLDSNYENKDDLINGSKITDDISYTNNSHENAITDQKMDCTETYNCDKENGIEKLDKTIENSLEFWWVGPITETNAE